MAEDKQDGAASVAVDTVSTANEQELPSSINLRKWSQREAALKGAIKLSKFKRLQDLVHPDSAANESDQHISVDLQTFVDDHGRQRISGSLRASLSVACQRCLNPVGVEIDTTVDVVAVTSQGEADALDRDIDAVICDLESVLVVDLLEDELILNVPIVAYHEESHCVSLGYDPTLAAQSRDENNAELAVEQKRESPFSVLEALKKPPQ